MINESRAREAAETELVFVKTEINQLRLRAEDSEKRAERAERLLRTTTERCKWFFNLSQRIEEERAVAQQDTERLREKTRHAVHEILRLTRLLQSKVELIEQAARELERLDRSPTTAEKSDWRRLLYAAVNDIKGMAES